MPKGAEGARRCLTPVEMRGKGLRQDDAGIWRQAANGFEAVGAYGERISGCGEPGLVESGGRVS